MKFTLQKIAIIILLAIFTSSCQFVSNTKNYSDSSIQFLEQLMNGEIEESYNQFDLENKAFDDTNKENLKEALYQFRA